MKKPFSLLAAALLVFGCDNDGEDNAPTTPTGSNSMGFFVTSSRSSTGNLGGLSGADRRCQDLAAAAGFGSKTWHAYLSAERDPATGQPVDARGRIGNGPWFNANGVMVAPNLAELHSRRGDAQVFVDERNQMIAGQWAGSPRPVEHDILTGSTADGRLMPGMTCDDWTSSSDDLAAQVGHSDGLGPNASAAGTLSSWNSSHANQSCADTAPRGGSGRIYCFATN
jgi:hypothetical protein